jgi:hypothetical protein
MERDALVQQLQRIGKSLGDRGGLDRRAAVRIVELEEQVRTLTSAPRAEDACPVCGGEVVQPALGRRRISIARVGVETGDVEMRRNAVVGV